MDESRYKLYYFDARGRGELIRLIFHAAGESFEDIRVHKGMWDQLKPAMPFQTLPVLEFDGHQLSQSLAIARYLASVFDLGGRNNFEKALVDSVAETVDELLSDALKVIFEPEKKYKLFLMLGSPSRSAAVGRGSSLSRAVKVRDDFNRLDKERGAKKLLTVTLPKKLDRLEEYKRLHAQGYGYVVGNDLSYADLFAYSVFDQIASAGLTNWEFFEQYSYPSQLRKRVLDGEPRISQYLHNQMR